MKIKSQWGWLDCEYCDRPWIAIVEDSDETIEVCEKHLKFYKDLGLPYRLRVTTFSGINVP